MKLAVLPLSLLLLAGCATDDAAYPSLAARPAEGRGFAEPTVAPAPPLAANPALDANLAALSGRLEAVIGGFAADARRAERAAAGAGARTVGSESWIAAQTALAALDDWRAQTGGIATEIDAAARTRAETVGTPYPALDALRARVEGEASKQGETIAAIGARLPTP